MLESSRVCVRSRRETRWMEAKKGPQVTKTSGPAPPRGTKVVACTAAVPVECERAVVVGGGRFGERIEEAPSASLLDSCCASVDTWYLYKPSLPPSDPPIYTNTTGKERRAGGDGFGGLGMGFAMRGKRLLLGRRTLLALRRAREEGLVCPRPSQTTRMQCHAPPTRPYALSLCIGSVSLPFRCYNTRRQGAKAAQARMPDDEDASRQPLTLTMALALGTASTFPRHHPSTVHELGRPYSRVGGGAAQKTPPRCT